MTSRHKELKNVEIVHLHTEVSLNAENSLIITKSMLNAIVQITIYSLTFPLFFEGKAEYADAKYTGSFKVNNLFVGANLRSAVQEGRAGYIPVFLSEVPLLFKRDILPLDAALIHVSPPDKHGYCSLGKFN